MPSRTIWRSSRCSARSAGCDAVVAQVGDVALVDRLAPSGAAGRGASSTGSARRDGATAAARRPAWSVAPMPVGAGERVLEDLLRRLPIAGQAVGRPVDRACGSGRRTPRRRPDRRPACGASARRRSSASGRPCHAPHPGRAPRSSPGGAGRRCPLSPVTGRTAQRFTKARWPRSADRTRRGCTPGGSVRAGHLAAGHRPPAEVRLARGGRLVEPADRGACAARS